MIDRAVHEWLSGKESADLAPALIVQFDAPPEELLTGAKTRAERIQIMESHLGARVTELTRGLDLPEHAVRVLGAVGQAIIHAPAETLRRMVVPEGALARAADVRVRPNALLRGPGM